MFRDVTEVALVQVDVHDDHHGQAVAAKALLNFTCAITLMVVAILVCIPDQIPTNCACGIIMGTASVIIINCLYNIAYRAWKISGLPAFGNPQGILPSQKQITPETDEHKEAKKLFRQRIAQFVALLFLMFIPCIVAGAMHFSGFHVPGPLLGSLVIIPIVGWIAGNRYYRK